MLWQKKSGGSFAANGACEPHRNSVCRVYAPCLSCASKCGSLSITRMSWIWRTVPYAVLKCVCHRLPRAFGNARKQRLSQARRAALPASRMPPSPDSSYFPCLTLPYKKRTAGKAHGPTQSKEAPVAGCFPTVSTGKPSATPYKRCMPPFSYAFCVKLLWHRPHVTVTMPAPRGSLSHALQLGQRK